MDESDRIDDDDSDQPPIPNRRVHSFSQPLPSSNPQPPPLRRHHHSYSIDHLPPPLPPHLQNIIRRPSSSSFSENSTMTLECAMSEFGGAPGTLPEFMGQGGGTGIFKVPIRAAVHPARPPALELRPHPLRETQYNAFLRTIVCYQESEIWAGTEAGMRSWKMKDMYVDVGSGRRGDEESVGFRESGKVSGCMCMVVDLASAVIWSGHKDGKIRSWRIVEGEEDECFKEGLSWQAHRGPVLSMIVSSYGILYCVLDNCRLCD